jgi:uncharacterized membrane protein (GlpM family)
MTLRTIEPEQHTAAKVAGFLYLVTMVIPLLGELFLRAPLISHADAARTARNIVASERLFRLSIVSGLMTVAAEIILLVALYIVLEPINRNVSLVAAFWRLAKCVIFALIAVGDFIALRLLSGAGYLRAFETKQLQALAELLINARHDVGFIGAAFLGLGSTVFAYLWLKSRYIPRGLAAWGIFSSLVMVIGILAMMVFPGLGSVIGPAYWAPMFIFEVILGLWLLVKGIQPSMIE